MDVINHYKNWRSVIKCAVVQMLEDVKQYEFPHEIHDKRIVVEDKGEFNFNVVNRYKTAFLNIHEYEQNKITQKNKDEALFLNIKGGEFSYFEIAKTFKFILGVTGTLGELDKNQEALISSNNYLGIKLKTFLPSVYGHNIRKFDKNHDCKIFEENSKYISEILTRIDNALAQKRAILVFFDTEAKIHEFEGHVKDSEIKYSIRHENLTIKLVI